MNTIETLAGDLAGTVTAPILDMKLEVVIVPVSDIDRSKEFYTRLGWRLDADFQFDNGFRVVQVTPPGLSCSVQFGTKLTASALGSVRDFYLVVSDLDDWAWRKGHRYGTILCDLERGKVVDLLPDRCSERIAQWLRTHPGTEIVSRDRATLYAQAARAAVPQSCASGGPLAPSP